MEIDWFALLKAWLVVGPLVGFGALELLIRLRDRRREALSRRTLEPMTRVDDGRNWWNAAPAQPGWWNRPRVAVTSWDRRREARAAAWDRRRG